MCDCENRNTDSYVIAWRAWYEKEEFNSIDHCLEKLPKDGFQAMRLWYADGTGRYLSGNDYYFFLDTPEGLIFGQSNDLDIKERYTNAFIKRGKHISEIGIKRIHELMYASKNPLDGN